MTPLAAAVASAQSLTWDASGVSPTSPADGSGIWNTLNGINWSNGTIDTPWVNGDTAVIGNGGSAGTITIDDLSGAVTAAGITINSTSGSDYTIAGESLNLTGATPTITVAGGQSPTISSALSGNSGLTVAGAGTLNLAGNNANLSGTIYVSSGALTVGAGGLGASTNAVVVGTTYPGTPSTTTTIGAISLAAGASYTVGSFASQTNSTSVNSVNIPSGATLNVISSGAPPSSGINAAFAAGALLSNTTGFSGSIVITTSLTLSGGGSLSVNGTSSNSSFLAGMGDANNTGSSPIFNMSTTLNMVGLSSFTFVTGLGPTPTGNPPAVGGNEFDVGVGIGSNANLSLATNNSITAGTIDIGDSDPTPGSPTALIAGDAGTTTGTLMLGAGTNTLTANTLLMGVGRGFGTILWSTNAPTGSVNIAGPSGTAINMTIGMETGGTPGAASSLNLTNATGQTGHSVNVTAGTIILGDMVSGGTGKSGSQTGGSISFDTGVFNVQTLVCSMANTAGNTSDDTVAGTFQVGTGPSSTGVLNVGSASTPGEFLLGDYTAAGGSGSGEKATLSIKGGTANIYCNIVDVSTAGSTGGTYGAFLSLTGGTLNMNGNDIGSTAGAGKRHVSLTFPTSSTGATLENLGGTGINDAGLNMVSGSATGVLTLTGSNTYSGGTTITSGVLAITSDAVIPGGEASLTFNGGALEFKNYASGYSFNNIPNLSLGAASGATTPSTLDGGITGNSALTFVGPGTLILAGSNNYTGATNINGGTLDIASDAEVNFGVGGITINGGNLQFNNYASTLALTGANTGLGAAIGAASSLSGTVSGGTLTFAGPGTLNLLASNNYSGPTNLNKGTLGIATDAAINFGAGGINFNGGTLQFTNTTSTLALSAANLSLGAAAGAGSMLSGNITDGTAVPTVLTYSGPGSLVLTGANTYSGGTNVPAGTLIIGTATALPANANVAIGTTTTVGTVTTTTIGVLQLGTVLGSFTLGSLSVNTGSSLDITSNSVFFNYTTTDPIATIASYLTDGFNAGWAAGEIRSSVVAMENSTQSALSYSIGYADGADGPTVTTLPSGTIEILPTLAGDAKMQGNVVFGDFQILAQYFGLAGGWDEGNFKYESTVNFGDFQLLAQDFGSTSGGLTAGELASMNGFAAQFGDRLVADAGGGFSVVAVPEPASIGILVVAGVIGMRRRRTHGD